MEETQRVLKVGGHSELYPRLKRDALILFAVRQHKDIDETNEMLIDNGFSALMD